MFSLKQSPKSNFDTARTRCKSKKKIFYTLKLTRTHNTQLHFSTVHFELKFIECHRHIMVRHYCPSQSQCLTLESPTTHTAFLRLAHRLRSPVRTHASSEHLLRWKRALQLQWIALCHLTATDHFSTPAGTLYISKWPVSLQIYRKVRDSLSLHPRTT